MYLKSQFNTRLNTLERESLLTVAENIHMEAWRINGMENKPERTGG